MSESQKARSGRWYLHRERETRSLQIVPVALVECDAARSIPASRILHVLLLDDESVSKFTISSLVSNLMTIQCLLI